MIKEKIAWGIGIVLLVGLIGFYTYTRYSKEYIDGNNFVNTIREEIKPGIDSLQNKMDYENNLNYRIEKCISAGDFKTASALMDSLPLFLKSSTIHCYKGMIYAEQRKYFEAIQEYNKAIDEAPFPTNLNKRAEAYIKINKLDSALNDYKKSYFLNDEFSYQVASTFELLHKKDSALKYYQIFSGQYPNDTTAQKKVSSLMSN